MLKITELERGQRAVVLRLEGRVVGPWVTELQQSCEDILAAGDLLRLHLADVQFMDPQGVALLTTLQSRGVKLLDCPPFAAEQLRARGGKERD